MEPCSPIATRSVTSALLKLTGSSVMSVANAPWSLVVAGPKVRSTSLDGTANTTASRVPKPETVTSTGNPASTRKGLRNHEIGVEDSDAGEVASAWTVRRSRIYWFARFGPNAANIVHRQDVVRVRWARIKWTRRAEALQKRKPLKCLIGDANVEPTEAGSTCHGL